MTIKKDACIGIEDNRKGFEPALGGKFVIINWLNQEIVYIIDLDASARIFIDSNHLYIDNNRLNYINIIDLNSHIEIRCIDNPGFNCLPSIHRVEI
ncbi:unnamed protein product [Rotaria sp. Silwood1]|nr:unnamed protein product [Rotaria sp. Silwood1]CAF1577691.1 unnamed protein product [Rotaria sp. Silwood1]